MSDDEATVGAKRQRALQLGPRKKPYGQFYCGDAPVIDIRTVTVAQIPLCTTADILDGLFMPCARSRLYLPTAYYTCKSSRRTQTLFYPLRM